MCERIAAFYDESFERAIDNFSKVFETVLILIVGVLVGLVMFLLYIPIFKLPGVSHDVPILCKYPYRMARTLTLSPV